MPVKQCSMPGCPHLTKQTRCPKHARGKTAARGYDGQWQRLAASILERDSHVCHYCGGIATSVDHVTPKAVGGTDHPGGLVAACIHCNSGRTARLGQE